MFIMGDIAKGVATHSCPPKTYLKTCCSGPVEADPEYLLIVEANNLAAEIDSETNTIHKFAR